LTAAAPFDRQGYCPQCGAPVVFRFAAAHAQVCAHCRFVVVRTDRNLTTMGKVADLVAIPSPFRVGASGTLSGSRFRIGGRVQYDRVEAASAPWQEQFIEWENGSWSWLAQAQGRLYLTALYQGPLHLPTYQQAVPGTPITIGQVTLQVTERAARRLVSGEGELPFPIQTGVVEWYADLSGPNGAFGTIDYGDGSSPPVLYLGSELPFSQLALDPDFGPPPEAPEVKTRALECPGCGGNLPLVSPDTAERVICPYCQMASDMSASGLVPLKKLRKPPSEPQIPLGSRGTIQGRRVTCIAFLVRGTTVDGERYHWREYLLYVDGGGYLWLLEEDEQWQLIRPIAPGDVRAFGSSRAYEGVTYTLQQSNTAEVEHVLGEMYWKVEVGEKVKATEWKCGKQRLSEERTDDEVVVSHSVEISRDELREAFAGTKLRGLLGRQEYKLPDSFFRILATLFVLWCGIAFASCIFQADETVFFETLEVPTSGPFYDDDDVVVGDKTCATWRASGETIPAGCQPGDPPDRSIFTPVFEVARDKKNLRIELEAPNLDDSWIGADLALIDDERGDVYEREVDLEYYSGVEDGESWSEGSRSEVLWFSRLPKGRYLVRIDPVWEARAPTPVLRLRVQSDTPRWSFAGAAFLALAIVSIVGIHLDMRLHSREQDT